MSHTQTEPTRTGRVATRSQTREGSQRLGSPLPFRTRSTRRTGTPSPTRKSGATSKSSHGPIRKKQSRELEKYRQTGMDEYWRDPILDEESQVLGNPSAPTLTRGSGFTSESLRAHKDNDSFDENAEYQESVTRGDENYQAELLREIELENETQYFDADGNTVPTYLEDHMDQETDEAQKEAQEQGLRHEYQV